MVLRNHTFFATSDFAKLNYLQYRRIAFNVISWRARTKIKSAGRIRCAVLVLLNGVCVCVCVCMCVCVCARARARSSVQFSKTPPKQLSKTNCTKLFKNTSTVLWVRAFYAITFCALLFFAQAATCFFKLANRPR